MTSSNVSNPSGVSPMIAPSPAPSLTEAGDNVQRPLTLRAESREWFRLAVPLMITLLCRTGMMLTDVSILGRWDSEFLGAAGISAVFISLTSVVVWRGLLDALNTLCAQAYGAKNYKLVGEWLGVGMTLSLIISVFIGLTWVEAGYILKPMAGIDDVEAGRVNTFCRISLIGLLPFSFYCGLSNFLSSLHIMKPLLYINLFSLIANVILNWVFVRGIDGWFDGLGFPGSPTATSVTRLLVLFLTMGWIMRRAALDPQSPLGRSWPKGFRALFWAKSHSESAKIAERSLYREYLALAIPIVVSSLLEEAQIQLVGLMAARLGDDEMATHNAVLQIFFVSSSFLWATAGTTQVRMSTHLGAGDTESAKVAMRIGTYVAGVCGASIAVVFIVAREHLAAIYSTNPEVRRLTGEIAYLVGIGYMGLSAFYVSMAVLSAQARPQFIAAAFLIGAWGVSVPAAYLFAFQVEKTKGLIGLWLGLTCGYIVVTGISLYGVCTTDWEKVTIEAVERSKRERSGSVPLLDEENGEERLPTSDVNQPLLLSEQH